MTGGYHSKRQRDRDRSLADRVTGTSDPESPRPCWIRWPAATPGHVLGWHRDADGRWWALVTAFLPQEALESRPDS